MKYRCFAHFLVYTPHLKSDGGCNGYISKFCEVFLKAVKSTTNLNPALDICWKKDKKTKKELSEKSTSQAK